MEEAFIKRKIKPDPPVFKVNFYYRTLFLRLVCLGNCISKCFSYLCYIYLRC